MLMFSLNGWFLGNHKFVSIWRNHLLSFTWVSFGFPIACWSSAGNEGMTPGNHSTGGFLLGVQFLGPFHCLIPHLSHEQEITPQVP